MTEQKKTAKLDLGDQVVELPVVVGTENERAIQIGDLRKQTGYITLDEGYRSTGSCRSAVTFIDGEKGILRYRGIPIEQLAEKSTFAETAMLLIWGELPTADKLHEFRELLTYHEMIHEGLYNHYDGFPAQAPPMAILSAMINAVSCYHPDILEMESEATMVSAAARLVSKVRTIAAAAYKASIGRPIIYPNPDYSYCHNFLHMMFSLPYKVHEPPEEAVRALELFFILHADHEQNCSTSTVRVVGSGQANLFASVAAGVCALWGRLHGGANLAVIRMLDDIHRGNHDPEDCIKMAKDKDSGFRLMGFGHRVYKNYDPRARILKTVCDRILTKHQMKDPLLDIARKLEELALKDSYFVERKLYPNVDFYSGIILRAIGIPTEMFTVMFAIGRLPGWIAQWHEQEHDPDTRIARPRQIYTGPTMTDYVPAERRG